MMFSFRAFLSLSSESKSYFPSSVCAHVRKHTMAGIERDVKKDGKHGTRKKIRRERERGDSIERSQEETQPAKRGFPSISDNSADRLPDKVPRNRFHPSPLPPPPNSSGRVRINSRLAISSTTVSLSLPLFFFDCSLVHHANSRYPLASTPRGPRLLLFPFSRRERGYGWGEKKKRKKKVK